MAHVPDPKSGTLERRRVCASCARKAFVIALATKPGECRECHAVAVYCDGHARKEGTDREHAARKLRALAIAYRAARYKLGEDGRADGRADGLEQAADIIERGDF